MDGAETTGIMSLIAAMHEKFNLTHRGPPRVLDPEEKTFRVSALREELFEYATAETLVDEYDALLDMLVFLLGTFYRQGLPVKPGYEAVMRCNMAKELGQNGSKRGGFKKDLVKPEGWTGPEAELILILEERFSTYGQV